MIKEKLPPLDEGILLELAERLPTPFYLYDAAGIRAAARAVQAALGTRQFFPVKATPTAAILRLLQEEGCGMVCSSAAELELCARCGFSGEALLFLPNYPLPGDLNVAARLGAGILLDGPDGAAFAAAGCRMDVVGLRYNPGGSFTAGEKTVSGLDEVKFGMDEAMLLREAEALKALGTRAVGLHGYLCGNTLNPDYFPALARLLMALAVKVRRQTGMAIAYIDLSGGLGIPYRPEDAPVDLTAIGRQVRQAAEDVLAPAGLGETPLYTELGRLITGPSGMLVSRVVTRKQAARNYLGLDASAADLMRPLLYGAYHHLTVLGKAPDAPRQLWDVVGGIAENTDKFAVQRPLPDPRPGDVCVIHDAGAHGHSMGYNYGGKLRCAEYLYENGEAVLIRRAETPEDYWNTQVF